MAGAENPIRLLAGIDGFLTQASIRGRINPLPFALAYTRIPEIMALASTPEDLPSDVRQKLPAFRAYFRGPTNQTEIDQREASIGIYQYFAPLVTQLLTEVEGKQAGITQDGVSFWTLDKDPRPVTYGMILPDGRVMALKVQRILNAAGRSDFNENVTSLLRTSGNIHTPDFYGYEPLKGNILMEFIEGVDYTLTDELMDKVIDASLAIAADNVQIDAAISNLLITKEGRIVWIDTILPDNSMLENGQFLPEYQLANLVYIIMDGMHLSRQDARAKLLAMTAKKTFEGRPINQEKLAAILDKPRRDIHPIQGL